MVCSDLVRMETHKGNYGLIEVKNGKILKRPKYFECANTNREAIAFRRLKPRLNDLNIARLDEIYVYDDEDEKKTIFVCELWFEDVGNDLFRWCKSGWLFDPIKVLLKTLLPTIDELHEFGILHGDIHLGNICVSLNKDGELTAKLIDFGRSVVVRDSVQWKRHPLDEKLWVDPITGIVSNQFHSPSLTSEEATTDYMYNVSDYRDPMSVLVLVANESKKYPTGVTLGPGDDIHGLGMCVVRILTLFFSLLDEFGILNELFSGATFEYKLCILCSILKHNPAWDSSFLADLEQKLKSFSTILSDSLLRKIKKRLRTLTTVYSGFFDHLKEVYDLNTSQLVKACVHPDRCRRYYHGGDRKRGRFDDTTDEEGRISTSVHDDKVVHVMVGHCWVMTGVVSSGRVEWWYTANELKMGKERGKKVMMSFIVTVTALDKKLQSTDYCQWVFDFPLQKRKWLDALTRYNIA